MSNKDWQVMFTGKERAELLEMPRSEKPLDPNEIEADTLVSWISSGTEVVGGYMDTHYESNHQFPKGTGYASVSKIVKVGSDVPDMKVGDLVIGGGHQSWQRGSYKRFNKIPEGLSPENAVFARMIKISLPAFIRSGIRPPEKCMVVGLGLVGFWAAQLASMLGYDTWAFDTNPTRRKLAEQHGIRVVDSMDPELYKRSFSLGVDCTGNELAVLSLCQIIRHFGEISLVGVPWIKHSDLTAQQILHPVFYNFLTLRTGWECDMPDKPNLQNDSVHHLAALRYLAKGYLHIDPSSYEKVSPENPQIYYQSLMHNQQKGFGYMFDWRLLKG